MLTLGLLDYYQAKRKFTCKYLKIKNDIVNKSQEYESFSQSQGLRVAKSLEITPKCDL